MNKSLIASILVLSSSLAIQAAPTGLDKVGQLQPLVQAVGGSFAYVKLENGVQLRANGVTKNILFYGPTTVRVNANLGETYAVQPSIVVVTAPVAVKFNVEESADALTLTSPKLHIVADKKSGAVAFYRSDGQLMTREREGKIHQKKTK